MSKKFIANAENTDRGFAATIREIEQTNSIGRKLSVEMYRLGEYLHEERAFSAIQIFNWLGDSTLREYEKNGKKYVEIITHDKNLKIFESMKQWFLDAGGFGILAKKHLKCEGIFIRNNGKTIWQYPAYSRRSVSPFDVDSVVRKAAESISWGI